MLSSFKKRVQLILALVLCFLFLINCSQKESSKLNIEKLKFGKINSSVFADLYTLTNSKGMIVSVTNYGGNNNIYKSAG